MEHLALKSIGPKLAPQMHKNSPGQPMREAMLIKDEATLRVVLGLSIYSPSISSVSTIQHGLDIQGYTMNCSSMPP